MDGSGDRPRRPEGAARRPLELRLYGHGRIDREAHIWYGLMRIPFTAIDTRTPEKAGGCASACSHRPPNRGSATAADGRLTFTIPRRSAPSGCGEDIHTRNRIRRGGRRCALAHATGPSAQSWVRPAATSSSTSAYTGEKSTSKGVYLSRLDLATGKVTAPEPGGPNTPTRASSRPIRAARSCSAADGSAASATRRRGR